MPPGRTFATYGNSPSTQSPSSLPSPHSPHSPATTGAYSSGDSAFHRTCSPPSPPPLSSVPTIPSTQSPPPGLSKKSKKSTRARATSRTSSIQDPSPPPSSNPAAPSPSVSALPATISSNPTPKAQHSRPLHLPHPSHPSHPPKPTNPFDALLTEQARLFRHLERQFERYEKKAKKRLDKLRKQPLAPAKPVRLNTGAKEAEKKKKKKKKKGKEENKEPTGGGINLVSDKLQTSSSLSESDKSPISASSTGASGGLAQKQVRFNPTRNTTAPATSPSTPTSTSSRHRNDKPPRPSSSTKTNPTRTSPSSSVSSHLSPAPSPRPHRRLKPSSTSPPSTPPSAPTTVFQAPLAQSSTHPSSTDMSVASTTAALRRLAIGPSVPLLSRPLSTSAPRQARRKSKQPPNPDALPLVEAIRVLRALEISNPSSALSLELQTKQPKSALPLRGRISLPTDARRAPDLVLVFVSPTDAASASAARAAGANVIGGPELFPKVLSGEIQPTKVLCTPGVLPEVSKNLARYLGPKGLMPVAKRGTVGEGEELGEKVRDVAGTMEWRADKLGVVRAPVARMTFTPPAIESNIRAFIAAVREGSTTAAAAASGASTPASRSKRNSNILKVRLETTNGPSIELNDVL